MKSIDRRTKRAGKEHATDAAWSNAVAVISLAMLIGAILILALRC